MPERQASRFFVGREALLAHLHERLAAGGAAAEAKISAARQLGLPVLMIDRPALPARRAVATVDEVTRWLHGTLRGV